MLQQTGFFVLAFMFTAYVLLDGYDLGIAAVAPFVATTRGERGALMRAIGPFWNGNEVWLIAAGASLFGLYPEAYAVAFSGFYLPFIVALWLLMFRGIAIELRESIDNDLWHTLWDALFTLSSAALTIVFGVALGNLVRGVDLRHGNYFLGTFGALLNPFALGVGILALAALGLHGVVYAAMRIEEPFATRCIAVAQRLWYAVLAIFVAVTGAAFAIDHGADVRPVLSGIITLLGFAALIAVRGSLRSPRRAFLASSCFLTTLMAAAAATLFPYLVPNYPRGTGGLSIYDAGPSSTAALATMTTVIVVALVALLAYRTIVAVRMTRPIRIDDEGGYG